MPFEGYLSSDRVALHLPQGYSTGYVFATRQATAAVDGTIAWIGASNLRITELERAVGRDVR